MIGIYFTKHNLKIAKKRGGLDSNLYVLGGHDLKNGLGMST